MGAGARCHNMRHQDKADAYHVMGFSLHVGGAAVHQQARKCTSARLVAKAATCPSTTAPSLQAFRATASRQWLQVSHGNASSSIGRHGGPTICHATRAMQAEPKMER